MENKGNADTMTEPATIVVELEGGINTDDLQVFWKAIRHAAIDRHVRKMTMTTRFRGTDYIDTMTQGHDWKHVQEAKK